jgi:tRNA A37 threonylcarbamoyltransferase TsaD
VVPVNHIEAHVMTPRMIPSLQNKADFPYVSVLVTGGHTEIVLTRGVGLHTVMGFSIDIAIGSFLDTVAAEIQQRTDIFDDKKQISDFIIDYNKENAHDTIPDGYFNDILKLPATGKFLERLARYGDPREFEMPIPQKLDSTANMSFSGLQSFAKFRFYEKPKGDFKAIYDRDRLPLTFAQILNISSSAQFAAFCQVQRKLQNVIAYL